MTAGGALDAARGGISPLTALAALVGLTALFLGLGPAAASEGDGAGEGPAIRHGSKGWEIESADGNWLIQIDSRLQFRIAYPSDSDPITFDDFADQDELIFKVNRARLKVGGHAYVPWLEYYWEYELANPRLLDFRAMLTRHGALRLKVGQWKVHFNRERVISSGKQQLTDRSLINRTFTVDRQQGLSLYGTLVGSGVARFDYWVSLLTGTGRGATTNDDTQPMWMGRLQWCFLGRPVAFTGSDLARSEEPAGLVGFAAVTNRSPYTRFSSAGGGQLEGFEEGEAGQYRVNQANVETVFLYRGFAWQQEAHWKEIDDKKNGEVTEMAGYYAQLGSFLHTWISGVPEPLEVAVRYAFLDPDLDRTNDARRELSIALNVFFAGHRNKLTAEFSVFDFQEVGPDETDDARGRLQWDVSL